MLSFWVLLGLLTCATTALVVWPLLHRRTAAPVADEQARRLEVYRDRRREIAREREAGRLTASEAAAALDELVAEAAEQFPDAGKTLDGEAPARPGSPLPWALLSALVVPVVAIMVYTVVGSPAVVGLDPATLRGALTPESLRQAVDELEAQVRRNPDDGEAWAMLAEARRLQDRPADAAQAYARAVDLNPPHARLLADYAETLVLLADGKFSGQPIELLARALRIDPNDGKAVALMGAAQYREGNLPEALRYLRQLTRTMEPGSEEAARLQEAVDRIEAELAASPQATAAVPAPQTPAAVDLRIAGEITIDEALRATLPAGAVLFIVVRDPDGPRTPLAVRRLPVGQWPVRFTLGAQDAMDPSRPLSQAARLVVEARVSTTGGAMRQSGGPIGASAPFTPGERELTVHIDQRVP